MTGLRVCVFGYDLSSSLARSVYLNSCMLTPLSQRVLLLRSRGSFFSSFPSVRIHNRIIDSAAPSHNRICRTIPFPSYRHIHSNVHRITQSHLHRSTVPFQLRKYRRSSCLHQTTTRLINLCGARASSSLPSTDSSYPSRGICLPDRTPALASDHIRSAQSRPRNPVDVPTSTLLSTSRPIVPQTSISSTSASKSSSARPRTLASRPQYCLERQGGPFRSID